MPVNQASLIDQRGMILLELPMLLLITACSVPALWCYQQQLQQQFLQLERQQQAWRLAYYSLEAARTQQGQPAHLPPLPASGWQRRWQTSRLLASCRRLTVTVTAPGSVPAQLSAISCPLPPAVTLSDLLRGDKTGEARFDPVRHQPS